MERGSEKKPWLSMTHRQSADFRLPAVGRTLAVRAFRVTHPFAENTRTLTPNMGGHQWKGSAGYDCIVRQRSWFPLVADTQEVLKGERRAGWGYAELLEPVFKICEERWKIRLERWQGNSCGRTRISWGSTHSSNQQRLHEATPIELTHKAATPA